MINDRGTKKWTSIMLPEHAKMLEHIWKESEHKDKPILDEQKLIENEMLLQGAIHDNLIVEIKYFKDHDFQTIKGEELFVETQNRYLQLNNIKVELDDIIEVVVLSRPI